MKKVGLAPLWAALLVFSAPPHAAESAGERLALMARALNEVDFKGIFVYAREGGLESMYVERRQTAEGPRDYLLSLNGARREIVRDGQRVQCKVHGQRPLIVRSGPYAFLNAATDLLPKIDAYYRLEDLGADRVADFEASVIEAVPKHGDRFRYRLWVDRKTGMLLGSSLLGADGALIEQMIFTTLEVLPSAQRRVIRPDGAAGEARNLSLPGTWKVGAMPTGFRLIGVVRAEDNQQFVFSDGLANVSIYVEDLAVPGFIGQVRKGALNMTGLAVGRHRVVAVGDLPRAAIQRIAASVSP